ncbi:MAG: hypothetical protein JJE52_14345 [Acidimicrobiia bacterium]|nr:hypothetical protein [Acidimicrobiia bacterium]
MAEMHLTAAAPSLLDVATERLGRWLAGRTTRRSFLSFLGKLGVFVASGPIIATLLAEAAGARVCGQTGVSVKCATFDCDAVWGWCWYANGCCADGGLKKICDCCELNFPNVHGYCPTSTNVKCIVESCRTDPRVQAVPTLRWLVDDPVEITHRMANEGFGFVGDVVVLADVETPVGSTVAAPLAAAYGGPLLFVPRGGLQQVTAAVLDRLQPLRVVVCGPALPGQLDTDLRARGFEVERVGTSSSIGPFSEEVAAAIRQRTGTTRSVAIEASGISAVAAPVIAGYAAATGSPLLVGIHAARRAPAGVVLAGPELADVRAAVPGSHATQASDVAGLSIELANLLVYFNIVPHPRVAFAPEGTNAARALAAVGPGIGFMHPHGHLGPARSWLADRADGRWTPRAGAVLGGGGQLSNASVWELQSALNGFDVHRLRGVSGQGLPVLSQPTDERGIGDARVGPLSSTDEPEVPLYWAGRALDG